MLDDNSESNRKKIVIPGPSGSTTAPVAPVKTDLDMNKPIGRMYTDAVLNFLLRLACQVGLKYIAYYLLIFVYYKFGTSILI